MRADDGGVHNDFGDDDYHGRDGGGPCVPGVGHHFVDRWFSVVMSQLPN